MKFKFKSPHALDIVVQVEMTIGSIVKDEGI